MFSHKISLVIKKNGIEKPKLKNQTVCSNSEIGGNGNRLGVRSHRLVVNSRQFLQTLFNLNVCVINTPIQSYPLMQQKPLQYRSVHAVWRRYY
jgi:hypothetical protein